MDKKPRHTEEAKYHSASDNSIRNVFNPDQVQFESDKKKKKGGKLPSVQIERQNGFHHM